MRCPRCRANNPPIAHYCHRCGRRLVQPDSFRVLVGLLSGTGLTMIVLGIGLLIVMSGSSGDSSNESNSGIETDPAQGTSSPLSVEWSELTSTPTPLPSHTPRLPTSTYTPVLQDEAPQSKVQPADTGLVPHVSTSTPAAWEYTSKWARRIQ